MEYQNFLSYVIIVIIWSSMAILSVIVYFLFPPEITFWDKIYDKCSANEAKYRYVVRVMSADMRKGFDPKSTTMTMDILYDFSNTVSLKITPKMLSTRVQSPGFKYKASRFLLYRKDPLKEILKVGINHNGIGGIVVATVEIQEINSQKANVAYFGKEIVKVDKKKVSELQTEPAATQEDRVIEAGLRVTTTLTALEFIIFFFMAINLIIFLTVFVIPCSEQTICKDYSNGFSSSIFSGLTASFVSAVVFVITCAVHRYAIKKLIVNGTKICSMIRLVFLILMIVLGAAFGLTSAFLAAQNRRFPDSNPSVFYHEVYWMFAVGIAITVFFLFWISLLAIIAFLIGFFSEETTKPTDSATGPTMRTDSDKSSENDYYKALSQATKVKSISQYKGPIKSSNVTSNASNATKASGKEAKKPQEADDNVDDNYYNQLIKNQKNVKSISQY